MTNPIADMIKIEDAGDQNPKSKSAKKQNDNSRFQNKTEGFKINPKNFDWLLAGIDADRLKKILIEDDLKDEDIEGKIKLENTFAMVRDDHDGELQGNNNPLSDFNNLNLGNDHVELSEMRQRPDNEGVFEQSILRDGGQLDHSLIDNINLFDQYGHKDEEGGIEFSGFGLTFSNQEEEDFIKVPNKGKKNEKLRKDFEKLILGKDNNINGIDSSLNRQSKVGISNIFNCFSFDANTAFMEASTDFGGSKFSTGVVDRVAVKQDENLIK